MKTYAKIMHGAISFPSHFSKDAVSIIKKLLRHKATKRLGVLKVAVSLASVGVLIGGGGRNSIEFGQKFFPS